MNFDYSFLKNTSAKQQLEVIYCLKKVYTKYLSGYFQKQKNMC